MQNYSMTYFSTDHRYLDTIARELHELMRRLAPGRPAWEDLNAANASDAEMICMAREMARDFIPASRAYATAPLERSALH